MYSLSVARPLLRGKSPRQVPLLRTAPGDEGSAYIPKKCCWFTKAPRAFQSSLPACSARLLLSPQFLGARSALGPASSCLVSCLTRSLRPNLRRKRFVLSSDFCLPDAAFGTCRSFIFLSVFYPFLTAARFFFRRPSLPCLMTFLCRLP